MAVKVGVRGLVVMVRVLGRAGERITSIKVFTKIERKGYACTSVCAHMYVFAHVS